MVTARLHDGSLLDVVGAAATDRPSCCPSAPPVTDGEAAEQMRAWGADPDLGHTLATGLADAGFAGDRRRLRGAPRRAPQAPHARPPTRSRPISSPSPTRPGRDRFAYYGYSWLALAGLQLAIRTDRLTALAMGGFPPLGGPYAAMLTVTRAAHREARGQPRPPAAAAPPRSSRATGTAPRSRSRPSRPSSTSRCTSPCQDFDERAALDRLSRAAARVRRGRRHHHLRAELGRRHGRHRRAVASAIATSSASSGWTVEIIPGRRPHAGHARGRGTADPDSVAEGERRGRRLTTRRPG